MVLPSSDPRLRPDPQTRKRLLQSKHALMRDVGLFKNDAAEMLQSIELQETLVGDFGALQVKNLASFNTTQVSDVAIPKIRISNRDDLPALESTIVILPVHGSGNYQHQVPEWLLEPCEAGIRVAQKLMAFVHQSNVKENCQPQNDQQNTAADRSKPQSKQAQDRRRHHQHAKQPKQDVRSVLQEFQRCAFAHGTAKPTLTSGDLNLNLIQRLVQFFKFWFDMVAGRALATFDETTAFSATLFSIFSQC